MEVFRIEWETIRVKNANAARWFQRPLTKVGRSVANRKGRGQDQERSTTAKETIATLKISRSILPFVILVS